MLYAKGELIPDDLIRAQLTLAQFRDRKFDFFVHDMALVQVIGESIDEVLARLRTGRSSLRGVRRSRRRSGMPYVTGRIRSPDLGP